ncbi:hypothetical protein SGRA_3674 [Saprospira grandis str. Lewin]|uniref:Uncharacterized protein n=1 Tax=Saprospira grandis (strain Lewin) TaxID=984262 RepID=H6L6W5_SAPGL|nr:hypothetical protein SGRA_3674 [Saprospira grandis str. Lewin]
MRPFLPPRDKPLGDEQQAAKPPQRSEATGLAMVGSAAKPQTKRALPAQGRASSELPNVAPTSEARRRPQKHQKNVS